MKSNSAASMQGVMEHCACRSSTAICLPMFRRATGISSSTSFMTGTTTGAYACCKTAARECWATAVSIAWTRSCLHQATLPEHRRKFLDVNIMLFIPGRERTEAEWRQLYDKAGLEVVSIVPLKDNFGTSIVEGVKT